MRIINEPTAAAIAFGLDRSEEEKRIVVYDLGGGTFDVSILDIGDDIIEVIATSGLNHLGGDDFDQRIIDWLVDEFNKDYKINLRNDKQAMQRLKKQQKMRKSNCLLNWKLINLPFITVVDGQPVHLEKKLTRAKFEELIRDLVESTRTPIENAMKDANFYKISITVFYSLVVLPGFHTFKDSFHLILGRNLQRMLIQMRLLQLVLLFRLPLWLEILIETWY